MFDSDKLQFQDLQSEGIILGQATKLYNFKSQSLEVVSIFCFCLFQWMSFYLGWIYKKGQCTKNFFRVSTCFSNIFTHYIENLEIYIAFIISEPEFTVCIYFRLTAGACTRQLKSITRALNWISDLLLCNLLIHGQGLSFI